MNLEPIAVLLLILGAEFVNGWTDAPNAIATVVGSRSLSPRAALAMASVFNLIGVMSGQGAVILPAMRPAFAQDRETTGLSGVNPWGERSTE